MNKLTRVEFFRIILPLFGIAISGKWLAACSDDGGSKGDDSGGGTTPQPDCLNAGTNVSIGDNHGHTMSVSKDDVAAGTQKTYNIQGSSGHFHSVTLTAGHFASLASNQQISVSSDGGAHTHTITVSCKLA
jgi:hypothetical protein